VDPVNSRRPSTTALSLWKETPIRSATLVDADGVLTLALT